MSDPATLPTVVIGAGPVGLAAAARLVERDLPFLVLEKGDRVATAPRAWGHVKLFTPWRYARDAAAEGLLREAGVPEPDPDALPTGDELAARYLEPLAAHQRIAPHLVCGARVTGISRAGLDKMSSTERERAPLQVVWTDATGTRHRTMARAVIDASGTFASPNPMGVDGLEVDGEAEAADRIVYGIPDVLGEERAAYEGKRVLVVGSGHSAVNVVLDLVRLAASTPATTIHWAMRREADDRLAGGGLDDKLPARGALGLAAKAVVDNREVTLLAPFAAERIRPAASGLEVAGRHKDAPVTLEFDRIVVATGFRPDLDFLREVRVSLDPWVEAPPQLAPLIDPNLHSCGTVPPHGAAELAQPEPGFFIVGSKSYGRAPTFLMATGYEQVRSVVAEIVGDHEAARQVHLVLPETGVCNLPEPEADAGCCGGPADTDDACCRDDALAKAAGQSGCGCSETQDAVACCGEAA